MNKNDASFTRFFFFFAILMVVLFHIGCSESDDTDDAETLNTPDNSQEVEVSNPPAEQVEEPLDGGAENADVNGGQDAVDDPIENPVEVRDNAIRADVTKVTVSGNPGVYTLKVTVKSPDTGCEQYANWWEVLSEDGKLLYRRILLHSHVGEQPFTRSGNPVPVQRDTIVIVRAHMNTAGYGGDAVKGSVEKGFEPVKLAKDFAADVEKKAPQAKGCAF